MALAGCTCEFETDSLLGINIMNRLLFILLLIGVTALDSQAQGCPYTDQAWELRAEDQKESLLEKPLFEGMDDFCFQAFLQRVVSRNRKATNHKQVMTLIRKYCQVTDRFSPELLHTICTTVSSITLGKIATDVITLWKLHNGSFERVIDTEARKGRYQLADQLYSDFERLAALDVYHLIKWAQIKGVLQEYAPAAKLYCQICQQNKSFITMAQSQLTRLLVDADSPAIRKKTLLTFRDCRLTHLELDTLAFSKWLSNTFGRFELYDEEVAAVLTLDNNKISQSGRLYAIAKKLFRKQRLKQAITPALKAWEILSSERDKKECALILHHAYLQTANQKQALLWLERMDLSHLNNRIQAVTLFQQSNLFNRADSLITAMPQSVYRDTLSVRQHLFAEAVKKAKAVATAFSRFDNAWTYAAADNFLWKIRTAAFSGDLFSVTSYIDSLKPIRTSPTWSYTAEFLQYRLATERLMQAPDAFAFWGALQYHVYLGVPQKSLAAFNPNHWSKDVALFVALPLIESLIHHKLYDRASIIIEQMAKLEKSVAISYYQGYINYLQGDRDSAKKYFEDIIVTYPNDVYAHKARIQLLKIKKEKT